MYARGRQLERREQRVEGVDGAAADHRERAAERGVGARQQGGQGRIDADRVGCLGELEQRAVEVEEQADPLAMLQHAADRFEGRAGAIGGQRPAPGWRTVTVRGRYFMDP